MSIKLAYTFLRQARDASAEGDKQSAIASMQSVLCCRDLPEGYRREAAEIMTLLLEECFKVQP